jgi:hypothetical protein
VTARGIADTVDKQNGQCSKTAMTNSNRACAAETRSSVDKEGRKQQETPGKLSQNQTRNEVGFVGQYGGKARVKRSCGPQSYLNHAGISKVHDHMLLEIRGLTAGVKQVKRRGSWGIRILENGCCK